MRSSFHDLINTRALIVCDEAEASRLAALSFFHDDTVENLTIFTKMLFHLILGGYIVQTTNEYLYYIRLLVVY